MAELRGKFDWKTPGIVPAFLQGEDAKVVWDATKGVRSGVMGYDENKREVYGNTPFFSARVDTFLRPLGLRVVNLRDLSRPEIMGCSIPLIFPNDILFGLFIFSFSF